MNFRNYIKTLVIFILLALPFYNANAQQDAQYTQYMYNTLAINPGYTGSRGVLSIAALHRSQWVGLDGAPTTQTFNIHSPINNRVGLGLSIVNDEIGNGTNQDTYFDGTFSYTILTSETDKLSFGLKAGGHFLNIDFNQLRVYDPSSSPPGTTNIDKKFSPNFGAGVYFHNDRFYAGISVPNFLETKHFDSSDETYVGTERMNWYVISGYVFDLSYNFKLKPAILIKGVNGAPLQADASATILYNDKFSLGAGYRWDAAVSALLGFQITERLMVGLAYDKETTTLGASSFNDGSFEVFIRYEFKSRSQNALTPRFF
jgi:type IX secretion system PorP/SprF family membrane protein